MKEVIEVLLGLGLILWVGHWDLGWLNGEPSREKVEV
jgi:hypothetical protein